MTRDEFSASYRLLKCLTEVGVRSYNAVETASSDVVMVHLMNRDDAATVFAVDALVDGLSADDRSRILARGTLDGHPFLVTSFLPSFTSLQGWLAARVVERPMALLPELPQLSGSGSANHVGETVAKDAGEPAQAAALSQPTPVPADSPAPPTQPSQPSQPAPATPPVAAASPRIPGPESGTAIFGSLVDVARVTPSLSESVAIPPAPPAAPPAAPSPAPDATPSRSGRDTMLFGRALDVADERGAGPASPSPVAPASPALPASPAVPAAAAPVVPPGPATPLAWPVPPAPPVGAAPAPEQDRGGRDIGSHHDIAGSRENRPTAAAPSMQLPSPQAHQGRLGSATDLQPIVRADDRPAFPPRMPDMDNGRKPTAEPNLRVDILPDRPSGSATELIPVVPKSGRPLQGPSPAPRGGDVDLAGGGAPRPVPPASPRLPSLPAAGAPAPPAVAPRSKLVPLLLILMTVAIVAIGSVLLIIRR
jgi:hypothetical protein